MTNHPGQSSLRLSQFIGQERLRAALQGRINKARENGDTMPHLILSAAPDMGKLTLATAVANEMGVEFSFKNCGEISSTTDLTGILSKIRLGQLLVLEEPQLLEPKIRNLLVEAFSAFRVPITVGSGPRARMHTVPIPTFTFVGLTSKLSRVDPSIRRWCVMYEFDPYTDLETARILKFLAEGEQITLADEVAVQLAAYCGGSPGNAAAMAKRIGRECGIKPNSKVPAEEAPRILSTPGLDVHYPRSLRLLDALHAMDGRTFEHWVAGLFRRQGFVVHLTDATGDHGIDLFMTTGGETTAVQCKRWEDPVGEAVLRDFYGAMVSAGLGRGIVVTTSSFTASAREFAQNKPIRLIDQDALLQIGSASPASESLNDVGK